MRSHQRRLQLQWRLRHRHVRQKRRKLCGQAGGEGGSSSDQMQLQASVQVVQRWWCQAELSCCSGFSSAAGARQLPRDWRLEALNLSSSAQGLTYTCEAVFSLTRAVCATDVRRISSSRWMSRAQRFVTRAGNRLITEGGRKRKTR